MPAKRPLRERFWEKVNKQGPVGPYVDTPCWCWTAATNSRGYGLIGVKASRPGAAHRVCWELTHGPIPKGLHVLHRCHNRQCVNPSHLYLGTHAQNMRDRSLADRVNAPQGSAHPHSRLTEKQALEILSLRQQGATYRELADKCGVSRRTVSGIIDGRSWCHLDRSGVCTDKLKPGVRHGADHPCFRLTPETLQAATLMRSQGSTYREIATALGISPASAWKACNKAA